jgi:D-cysteine desulfhydrase
MLAEIARVRLANLPTPLRELERLSDHLGGARIYIKRDDLTGLATGGNKARKLEFLVADALARGATTLITAGAPQSNHARQTAAAAAQCGLRCVLVLGPQAPAQFNGNLLIDRLTGTSIRWAGDRDRGELMQEVANEERAAGRKPYIIPYGGSSPIGATGYVVAMDELARQMIEQGLTFDRQVFATSSGGTQAGMVLGAKATHYAGQILGISVDKPAAELGPLVLDLAQRTASHLDLRLPITPADVVINSDYLGGGYAVMGSAEREAIGLAARLEGLLVDPVYTGRALAGLLDLVSQGAIDKKEKVLFWHTGGTAALFAYADELLRPGPA